MSKSESTVYVIRGTVGYIDIYRRKTMPAHSSPYRLTWKTEAGARAAFATIEHTFPKLGPEYALERAIVVTHEQGWTYPETVEVIATK